jgi:hypothetical protein
MAGQDVISQEQLNEMLSRYAIGKKPLAALLGWGATTILRYADGVCPAGEYGTHLKKLYKEPLFYLEVLEANKDRLTPVAYKKSKQAVLSHLTASKLWCGVQYLIERAQGDISPLRIVMTLYYAQAFSLGIMDKAIFTEDCDLTARGIPYATHYEQLKATGIKQGFSAEGLFADEEKAVLDAAYRMLLWYGPAELENVLLAERKYLHVSRMEGGGKKIKNAALGGFFKKVVQGYKITRPEEFNLYFAERTGRGRKR